MGAMKTGQILVLLGIALLIQVVALLIVATWPTTKTIEAVPVGVTTPSQPNFGTLRGGVIRLGPGCPCLHFSGDHAAVGITAVGKDASGNLTVDTDFTGAELLVTAQADVDATMARKRVNCGVSGGGVHSVVLCVRQDTGATVRADSSYWDPASDNLWFYTWAIPE